MILISQNNIKIYCCSLLTAERLGRPLSLGVEWLGVPITRGTNLASVIWLAWEGNSAPLQGSPTINEINMKGN